ncbi:MAG: hypothetical protein WBA05_13610 [Gordonia sp. (in: high G+C Gram-positive bacteria)]|uniref:hypothetical protein n=1 Tax=Gordonia TaxID=2053 RepID=UPI0032650F8C
MTNRYLRYGDRRFIITREIQSRLDRALDKVYASGSSGHEWLSLYPDSEAECRLLIAAGVPISIETEPQFDGPH